MTDITELAQRMKAAAVRAKAATEDYVAHRMSITVCLEECKEFNDLSDGPDNILALVEALEKAQRANAAQDDHINQQQDRIESLEKKNAELGKYAGKLETINAAAEKLVRCKGRYHSEQNYRALAALFGVNTPDLPPLDGEPVGEVIEVGDALLVEWHKNLEEGAKLYTAPQAPVMPFGLHPDTQKLVTDFCTALADKLYKAQLKYGYDKDWKQDGWPSQCQSHFHQHIAKGDPRDVAAYCAFMWWHGWSTKPAEDLESRTVTVKLPHQTDFDDPRSAYEAIEKCKEALTAAGIKWEAE